jgi:hypothetical protein
VPHTKVCENPACRKPLSGDDAPERSTKRFCTTRCRVAFNRLHKKPSPKLGLRRGQRLILFVLSKERHGLTRKDLSKKLSDPGTDPPHFGLMSDYLGHITKEKRERTEKEKGYPSLLTLGYVTEGFAPHENSRVQDRTVRCYTITPAGRRAFAEIAEEAKRDVERLKQRWKKKQPDLEEPSEKGKRYPLTPPRNLPVPFRGQKPKQKKQKITDVVKVNKR